MSISINKQGIQTSSNQITFTDNNCQFIIKNDYIEAPNYYLRGNCVFKKGSSFLFKKVAFNIVSNGSVVFDLITNTTNSTNVAAVEYKSTGYENDVKLFDVSYSMIITTSQLSANDALAVEEKAAFLSGSSLTGSKYSSTNKPPIIDTSLPAGIQCSITDNKLTITSTVNSSNLIYLDIMVTIK